MIRKRTVTAFFSSRFNVVHTGIQILLVTFGLTFGVNHQACANITSMGEAINIAGRQRMLSQRIAQSYLLMGIQPQSKRGSTQLNRSITEFQNNLIDLTNFKPAKALRPDIAIVDDLWKDYKRLAELPVNKERAAELVEQSNKLLAAAHSYVNKLEKVSGTTKAELINISGRQRMLSQRIAKNFLAKYWGVSDHATEELYADLAEYENVLNYLMESDVNTTEIATQLNKVKGYFTFASKGFDGVMDLSEERLIYVVTGTTDYMLHGMNVTTKMYTELLK